MIFAFRLEESNAYGSAPDLKMAGFLGWAQKWKLLMHSLRGLEREYGFNTFQATDFKHRKANLRMRCRG
jgi:hypothetical protein